MKEEKEMKLKVENIEEFLEVDEEMLDSLATKKLVVCNGNVCVQEGDTPIPIAYYLGIAGLEDTVKFKNDNYLDYRSENIEVIKAKEVKYTGVVYMAVKRLLANYMSYYYKDGKKVIIGYYFSAYDAAICREYFRRSRKPSLLPTGINLSYEKLKEQYESVTALTELKKAENREESLLKTHNSQRNKSDGIRENKNSFSLTLTYGDQRNYLGKFKTKRDAQIYRNTFIVQNKLDLKLSPLDIPIEKQLELGKEIKPDFSPGGYVKVSKSGSSKYNGVSKVSSTGNFRAECREGAKKITFLMSTKDEDLAAMAFNVYTCSKGIADKPVNDVGLSLEEQRKRIVEHYEQKNIRVPKALAFLIKKPSLFDKLKKSKASAKSSTDSNKDTAK